MEDENSWVELIEKWGDRRYGDKKLIGVMLGGGGTFLWERGGGFCETEPLQGVTLLSRQLSRTTRSVEKTKRHLISTEFHVR